MQVIPLRVENVRADDILEDETNKNPSEGRGNAPSEGCQTTKAIEMLGQRSSEDHFHQDNPKTAQTELKKAKCPVELCTNNKNVSTARAKKPERTLKVHAEFGKYNQGVEDSDVEETEF